MPNKRTPPLTSTKRPFHKGFPSFNHNLKVQIPPVTTVAFYPDSKVLASLTHFVLFFTSTADVQVPPVKSGRMKLKNLIPQRYRTRLIRQFGQAKLIRLPNGQHELIGGSDADRTDALEWVSIFAHEIVFTHYHQEAEGQDRSRPSLFTPRLQPTM